jgi:hypothetical protein
MSIRSRAEDELKKANFSESEIVAYKKILDIFFEEWNSGGAVSCAAPVLARLIEGKPLSPLTGDPEEWHNDTMKVGLHQNKRYSAVFFDEQNKLYFDATNNKCDPVSFPYHVK